MKDSLDILNKVQKADVPPFLYTRILQQIDNYNNAPASTKFKFSFAVAAMFVLLLNLSSVYIFKPPINQNLPAPTTTLITINNTMYNE